ncbi:metallophosphoesterase [Bdellovibrio sp. ZAP7]|uniref:metallophosphoesterase n=1 Tax=Bdellovibrio sp. ZAP7 TaxID=2231053 RepID=UPI001159DB5C|nr:metallophosphoesterase [Bdellovibrio sp. ZAP7]QDK44551.1 metallophosphoesterase [Bdellovibrio sp. ZAP7]
MINLGKKFAFKLLTIALIFTAGVLTAWAFWLEPRSLTVQNYVLQFSHEKSLPALRIGVVSDVHLGRYFSDEARLERIVGMLLKEEPDMIVFLGDFVAQRNADAFLKAAHQMKKLKAPLGVYSILGNHDWWANKEQISEALKSNGVRLIDNQVVELTWKDHPFHLVGFGDFWEDKELLDFIASYKKSDLPTIGLTHNPDVFPETKKDISLMLAGHTHGGQVNFPIVGAPIIPSRYGDRYRYGLISEKDHHILVTSGTGNSILPVRFRVPPEIVVVEVGFKAN